MAFLELSLNIALLGTLYELHPGEHCGEGYDSGISPWSMEGRDSLKTIKVSHYKSFHLSGKISFFIAATPIKVINKIHLNSSIK